MDVLCQIRAPDWWCMLQICCKSDLFTIENINSDYHLKNNNIYPQGLTFQEQVYYIIIDIVPDLEMIHCFIATILFRISQSDHSHQVLTKTGKIRMLATYTIQVVAW